MKLSNENNFKPQTLVCPSLHQFFKTLLFFLVVFLLVSEGNTTVIRREAGLTKGGRTLVERQDNISSSAIQTASTVTDTSLVLSSTGEQSSSTLVNSLSASSISSLIDSSSRSSALISSTFTSLSTFSGTSLGDVSTRSVSGEADQSSSASDSISSSSSRASPTSSLTRVASSSNFLSSVMVGSSETASSSAISSIGSSETGSAPTSSVLPSSTTPSTSLVISTSSRSSTEIESPSRSSNPISTLSASTSESLETPPSSTSDSVPEVITTGLATSQLTSTVDSPQQETVSEEISTTSSIPLETQESSLDSPPPTPTSTFVAPISTSTVPDLSNSIDSLDSELLDPSTSPSLPMLTTISLPASTLSASMSIGQASTTIITSVIETGTGIDPTTVFSTSTSTFEPQTPQSIPTISTLTDSRAHQTRTEVLSYALISTATDGSLVTSVVLQTVIVVPVPTTSIIDVSAQEGRLAGGALNLQPLSVNSLNAFVPFSLAAVVGLVSILLVL